VETIVTREPEFDTDQLDLLLAVQEYSRDMGPHGQLRSESTNPSADPNDYTGRVRYVAEGPFTDWAEKAEQDAIERYRSSLPDDDKNGMHGKFWVVKKKTIGGLTP
jgi:hypothetical protein